MVLVHYHTPGLLAEAVAALRRDAASSGLALELVVADNGSTAEEKKALAALEAAEGLRIAGDGGNLGYAGGLNAGAALLPASEVLVLMNTDVLVGPGCLAALAARIAAGVAAVGPRFLWDGWDPEQAFELPPTEAVGLPDELLRLAAARWGGAWAGRARRRWRRHAGPYFEAQEPRRGYDLSGALLMVEAAAFHRLGGFDPAYQLYFEETDFLERLRREGLRAELVPAAVARHLYAQSTPRDGRVARLYAESRERFRRRVYGRAAAALLRRLESGARPPAAPEATRKAEWLESGGAWLLPPGARRLELSPSPLGFPAALRRLPEGADRLDPVLSPELVARLAPGVYWLRPLDATGAELGLGRVEIAG